MELTKEQEQLLDSHFPKMMKSYIAMCIHKARAGADDADISFDGFREFTNKIPMNGDEETKEVAMKQLESRKEEYQNILKDNVTIDIGF